MSDATLSLLVVEDNPGHARQIQGVFERDSSVEVISATSLAEAQARIDAVLPDLVLADLVLGDGCGVELIADTEADRQFPVVVMTAYGDEGAAVEVMKAGALDYVIKSPEAFEQLPHIVARARREWDLRSEKRRADEALAQSQREWETTFNAMSDWVCLLDADLRVLRCNRAGQAFTGVSAGEACGRLCHELVHGSTEPVADCPTKKALETGEKQRLELQLPGDGRWLVVIADPVKDRDGTVVGSLHVVRDITEQKQRAEALRASETKYRLLFEESPAMYVITENRQGIPHIADCNELFLATLGYDRGEVLGTPLGDYYTPESQAALVVDGGYQRALLGEFTEEERSLVTRQGQVLETLLRAMPEYDADGRVVGTRAMFVDVTERKRAEEELRQSEEWFRSVFEASRDAIFVTGTDSRFVAVNEAAAALTGYSVAELKAMRIPDLHELEDLRAYEAFFDRILAGESVTSEAKIRRKDGTKVDTEFSSRRVVIGGVPYMHTTARDITERKRAEDEIRSYAKRLEHLSRQLVEVQEQERRRLARELHDEVGQMMTVIRIALQSAAEAPDLASMGGAVADGLQVVDEAIEQVRGMSHDLRPAMLDDLGLVPALLWYFRERVRPADLAAELIADREDLPLPPELASTCFRVIQECTTNCLRHAEAKKLVARVSLEGETLRLTVEDEGRGFDVETMLRRSSEGACFGLLGMRERVRLAGGTLEIQSNEGRGTRIEATFSIGEAESAGG